MTRQEKLEALLVAAREYREWAHSFAGVPCAEGRNIVDAVDALDPVLHRFGGVVFEEVGRGKPQIGEWLLCGDGCSEPLLAVSEGWPERTILRPVRLEVPDELD